MALNAAIQFEIRQAGSDTNGGGFKAGATGTDWSQQNAAQYALTNGGATTGSATITTVSAAADMVGNVVYVSGGTGSIAANWYEIISQVTGTSITLDRSTGLVTGTGVTLNIGGALATPGVLASVAGGLGGQLVAGHVVWIKYAATAYACSTSTSGPAGPCALPTVILRIRGYDASRGDATGNMPSYQWTAAAPGSLTYLFSSAGTAHISVENVQANGNSVNNVGGFSLNTRASAIGCIATNCIGTSGTGFNAGDRRPHSSTVRR